MFFERYFGFGIMNSTYLAAETNRISTQKNLEQTLVYGLTETETSSRIQLALSQFPEVRTVMQLQCSSQKPDQIKTNNIQFCQFKTPNLFETSYLQISLKICPIPALNVRFSSQ